MIRHQDDQADDQAWAHHEEQEIIEKFRTAKTKTHSIPQILAEEIIIVSIDGFGQPAQTSLLYHGKKHFNTKPFMCHECECDDYLY